MVTEIFDTLADCAPDIRDALPGRRTATGEENVTGDEQLAADVWADDRLAERLGSLSMVGEYASEERSDVLDVGSGYGVAVDPLDGSSNLRSNNPMGTIIGVYDGTLPASGKSLVAAGFVLYGPITTMVVAEGTEVTEYVLSNGDRTAVESVSIPAEPTVYGVGGRYPDWPSDVERLVDQVRSDLKLRYGGAMVADVSQVLTYGGIFGYPGLQSRPEGKLRLQFEGAPLAYVVQAAGGASSNGDRSLLEIEPTALHQRSPVYLGNESLIEDVEATVA